MKREYGGYLVSQSEPGFSVSLEYDLSNIPDDFDSTILQTSYLKRNCFASVFEKYFEFQENGREGERRAVIHYRENETL